MELKNNNRITNYYHVINFVLPKHMNMRYDLTNRQKIVFLTNLFLILKCTKRSKPEWFKKCNSFSIKCHILVCYLTFWWLTVNIFRIAFFSVLCNVWTFMVLRYTSNGYSFRVFLGSKKEFCILFFLTKWAKSLEK